MPPIRHEGRLFFWSGVWFLTAAGWCLARHQRLETGRAVPALVLSDPSRSDHRRVVDIEDVWGIISVSAEARYHDAWFHAAGAKVPKPREVAGAVTPVPFDEPDVEAWLVRWYDEGALFEAARAVPGVTVHDQRGSNGEADITVPLPTLTAYRASTTPVAHLEVAGADWTPRYDVAGAVPTRWP